LTIKNFLFLLFIHSLIAYVISASDFPASLALYIIDYDNYYGSISMSPSITSTPNFIAKSFTYFYFLILPIFYKLPWRLASAPKFGILAISSFYLAILLSVLAIPSSIAFWQAAILAFTSSTVSICPSSSSYLTCSGGSFSNYYY